MDIEMEEKDIDTSDPTKRLYDEAMLTDCDPTVLEGGLLEENDPNNDSWQREMRNRISSASSAQSLAFDIDTGSMYELDAADPGPPGSSLENVPIAIFTVALGLSGYSHTFNAWAVKEDINEFTIVSEVLFILSLVVYALSLFVYGLKMYYHLDLVAFELSTHPRGVIVFAPMVVALLQILATPEHYETTVIKRVFFWVFLIAQLVGSLHMYQRYFYNNPMSLQNAHPSYMLTLVGWFLLSNLASMLGYEEPAVVCLAIGLVMMVIVTLAVFRVMASSPESFLEEPTLFLMLAPVAQAAIALLRINDAENGYADNIEAPLSTRLLLSWDCFYFVILIKCARKAIFSTKPSTFMGKYWTYTFPVSSLATGLVLSTYARHDTSRFVLAIAISILVSLLYLLAIFQISRLFWLLSISQTLVLYDPVYEQYMKKRLREELERDT
jgi:tellurite resistance protein TehA-like permease